MRATRSRLARTLAVALAAGGLLIASPGSSTADVTVALELDGNVTNESGPAGTDWQSLFTAGGQAGPSYLPVSTGVTSLPTGFGAAKFFRDFAPGSTADASTFATGSKDTLPISTGWQCKKSNNVTDKGDIQNTYMTAFRDTNGHQIVYAAVEKNAPNGNNNMAVWLLQDENVGCSSGGGNTDFSGDHVDGDVLLVAAFLNGGSNPVIDAYEWRNGALDPDPIASGGGCGSTASNLCAITNDNTDADTPWITQDKNLGLGHRLQADQFYEMGADLTALQLRECFASYMANTRSSQSLGATLYDFSGGSAPTCGSGEVTKYIDVDGSGTNNTGDITGGIPVSGWSFTVKNSGGTTVCSGTTGTDGKLACSTGSLANLQPGAYTVTETLPAGGDYYNSDPGSGATPALTRTMNVTTAGGSATFGNACFVDAAFTVNKSTDASGFFIWYRIGAGTRVDVTSSMSGTGAKTANVNNTLLPTQSVSWGYGINHGTASEQVVTSTNSPIALSAYSYPTCAVSDSMSFAPVTVSGTKYKDANADGDQDAGELGIAGFTIQLKQGATVVATTTSGSNGAWSFSGIAPGTYTVRELIDATHTPNWEQTQPAGNAYYDVSITLTSTSPVTTGTVGGGSSTSLTFGNTPLSKIQVNFLPQAKLADGTTDATRATAISCVGPGSGAGSSGIASNTDSNTLTTGNIRTSKSSVVCTITFVDP